MHNIKISQIIKKVGGLSYEANLTMVSMLTGAVVNIVLDSIMIFGWFGLPALGIAGAAYATVIARL